MLFMKDTDCCAIKEICQLSGHSGPMDAMIAFCKINIVPKMTFRDSTYGAREGKMYSFYLFTGVATVKPEATAWSSYYSSKQSSYAQDFADFIESNKLGTVLRTRAKLNEAFHPDHGNQVFIWDLDQEALEAWWKIHKPKTVELPEFKMYVENPVVGKIVKVG